jgi:hypothetical protein
VTTATGAAAASHRAAAAITTHLFLARETAPAAAAPLAGTGRTDKSLSPAGNAPGTAA